MPSQSVACKCGQVSFDVSGREPGDKLSCPSCDRAYKYLGAGKIEAIGGSNSDDEDSSDEHEILTVEGSEEIFIHKAINPKETVRLKPASSRSRVMNKISQSGVKPDAPPDRSQRSRRPTDIPGGVLPMIVFMLVFNAIAFSILLYLFPKQDDGTRLTPWHSNIRHTSIPWPELATLFVGQVAGFLSWALYVYRFHNPKNAGMKPQTAAATPNKTSEVRRVVRKKPKSQEDEEVDIKEDDADEEYNVKTAKKLKNKAGDEADDESSEEDEEGDEADQEEELTEEELAELEAGEAELELDEEADEHEEDESELEEEVERPKSAKSAPKATSGDSAISKTQQKPAEKTKSKSSDRSKPKPKKVT